MDEQGWCENAESLHVTSSRTHGALALQHKSPEQNNYAKMTPINSSFPVTESERLLINFNPAFDLEPGLKANTNNWHFSKVEHFISKIYV